MTKSESNIDEKPFNPLDKKNLGVSVADAMLAKPVTTIGLRKRFNGAGIYAIYYTGDFPEYEVLAKRNRSGKWAAPIYVGKAVPEGARKGGFGLDLPAGIALHKRFSDHAQSIEQCENLELHDFRCRYLLVDDIWIPLGESLLIEMFSPVWNMVLDGFGNHDPGAGRANQQKSAWDVLHPGRPWAEKLKPNEKGKEAILASLRAFLKKQYG